MKFNTYTENEIIKALECCKNGKCTKCPRLGIEVPKNMTCSEDLMYRVCHLIKRQKQMREKEQETINKQKNTIRTIANENQHFFEELQKANAKNEEIAILVSRLVFDLRKNMTSITRYVKHTKSENITQERFEEQHKKYHELAEKAVFNILKLINENDDLRKIENIGVSKRRKEGSGNG